jgi:hypothetical protein
MSEVNQQLKAREVDPNGHQELTISEAIGAKTVYVRDQKQRFGVYAVPYPTGSTTSELQLWRIFPEGTRSEDMGYGEETNYMPEYVTDSQIADGEIKIYNGGMEGNDTLENGTTYPVAHRAEMEAAYDARTVLLPGMNYG